MSKTTRRTFLKGTAAAAGGAAAFGAANIIETPSAWATRLRKENKGRIVGVKHDGALKSINKEDPALVERMTHQAMLKFTGKKSLVKAWREFVSPSDIVGIKLNCLASPTFGTSPAMVAAIVKGLQAVGIPNDRIILYEQYEGRLTTRGSGYKLNEDPAKGPLVRHMGGKTILSNTGHLGYEKAGDKHGSGPSHFANMLRLCTAVINACIIKDHELAGVTVAMKNMTHGNINNPHDYHETDCHPAIAHIYDHPKIKDKVRLAVCDGLRVLYDGGPRDNPRAKVKHNHIYVAADPVALDSYAYRMIDGLRAKNGLKPLATRHPAGNWLVTAEKLGLGAWKESAIQCDVTTLS